METNLLDRMLTAYMTEQTAVTLTLQNKIRVTGKVKAFDSYVIVMDNSKREILYRHAVSSLAPAAQPIAQDEQKRQQPAERPAPAKAAPRPQKTAPHKPHPAHHPAPASASAPETGINTGMKEGLLKWIQEQKAAK